MSEVYDYEYFMNKTPFKNTLAKYADLVIDHYWHGYNYSRTYHYTISYNQRKFIENISDIKRALLKTKICQYLDGVRTKIEAIPENLDEYANAYAINRVFSNLVMDGCMKHSMNSRVYEWKVTEAFQENLDFNRNCAKKMVRPMLKLHEVNGWERESWNFYFDYTDNDLIVQLAKRLAEMPKVAQCNGFTFFTLNMVPIEFDTINFNGSCHGYIPKHNLVEGTLNEEKLKEVLTYTDNGLFEYMYKGFGIQDLLR